MLSNTYEITLVLFIMVFGLAYPSFIVAFFILICQNMLCISSFASEKRIKLGKQAMIFNLVMLLLVFVVKLIMMIRINKNTGHDTIGEMFAQEN